VRVWGEIGGASARGRRLRCRTGGVTCLLICARNSGLEGAMARRPSGAVEGTLPVWETNDN